MLRKLGVLTCLGLVAVTVAVVAQDGSKQPGELRVDKGSSDKPLARARREVKMLDDIYKTGVVLITENFVDGDSSVPAGTVFKQLFAAAKKNGWHEVRLLDGTGEAINDENLPQDDFEKSAIKSLVGGQPYVDKVIHKDGQRYLRAATPIPVVLSKCVECHDNYAKVPAGQAIGALAYMVPVQED
ncbi:MAG: DUF3365 domain-containing protein [Pirellulaceae bacterium]|nr:DUF3365 domain-containing protein [Pirellulaceae bacterium]